MCECVLLWCGLLFLDSSSSRSQQAKRLSVKGNRVVANVTSQRCCDSSTTPSRLSPSPTLPCYLCSSLQMTRVHSKLTKMSEESKASAMRVTRHDNKHHNDHNQNNEHTQTHVNESGTSRRSLQGVTQRCTSMFVWGEVQRFHDLNVNFKETRV